MELPIETERYIDTHNLGAQKKVYQPNTVGSIMMGLFIAAFAVVWIVSTLLFTGSPLLPKDPTSTQFPSFPTPTDPSFTTLMSVLGVVLPLIGLVLLGISLLVMLSALRSRHVRAILCEHGVAQITRERVDAFRWEHVVTVLDKIDVHTNETNNEDGSTSTSTTTSHTYTVVCKDGRRFIFNRALRNVEELGEKIQIAVALHQHVGSESQ